MNPGTKQVRFVSGRGAHFADLQPNPVKMGPLTICVIDLDNSKLKITGGNNYRIQDTNLQSVKQ